MRATFVTTVPACYGVKLARKCALRDCVMHSCLYMDFRNGSFLGEDLKHFSARMDDFVREKGLRIVKETPIARIDEECDRYVADVEFTITWD
jgi:hypothetical protein